MYLRTNLTDFAHLCTYCTFVEEKQHVVVNRTFMRKRDQNREPSKPFCPGCFRLNKSSNSQLHYQHLASQCPRKAIVKLLQVDDIIEDIDQLSTEEYEGNYTNFCNDQLNTLINQVTTDSHHISSQQCFSVNIFKDSDTFEAMISNIKSKINLFRKENSPTLQCMINEQHVICIIDEGSVINCCSHSFALKTGLRVENVDCSAVGANKSPMNVIGIVKHEVIATVLGSLTPATIRIATMIVINDLGADILLGQPSKVDNKIITIPHEKKVHFKSVDGQDHTVIYPLQKNDDLKLHDVLKVQCSTTLYPQDTFTNRLPNQFQLQ